MAILTISHEIGSGGAEIGMAVGAALNTVFQTAVYQYASHDQVPEGFDRQTMAHAFASK